MNLSTLFRRTMTSLLFVYFVISICITLCIQYHSHNIIHASFPNKIFWTTQAGLTLFFVLSILIVFKLRQRIHSSLRQLEETLNQQIPENYRNQEQEKSHSGAEYLSLIMNSVTKNSDEIIERLERDAHMASAELQETLAYFRAIVENLTDGLLVMAPNGRVSHTNPALQKLYGYEGVPLRDKEAELLFPPDLVSLMLSAMSQPRLAHSGEVALTQGKTGHASVVTIHPASREDSEILGVAALIRDITPDKEVDRMKNDFISTVSHELRTPLTSVQGFVKIVRKKLQTTLFPQLDSGNIPNNKNMKQVLDNLDVVLSEAGRLTDLVNDVLDISKMASGRVEWHMQPTDVRSLILQAAAGMKGLMDQKNLTLFMNIPEYLPRVSVDRQRLVQVLVNLLSNAVKFTNEGSISVSAGKEDAGVKITVADSGEGIDPRYHDLIFERFYQTSQGSTEKPKGTGLGLAISKSIVEAHSGRISVESEPGKGSSFHIWLPLTEKSHREAALTDKQSRTKSRIPEPEVPVILVADKEKTVREKLRRLFTAKGYRVLTAGSGSQALEISRMLKPDVIVMDPLLPGMAGAQFLSAIKSDFSTRDIPVIVISGAPTGQQESIDVALVKPIDEEALFNTVRNILLGGMTRDGSSITLSANGVSRLQNLLLLSPQHPFSIPVDKLWDYFDRGFSGTVLVPASISRKLDITRIIQQPGVQMIILPG